jgi:mRNA-binding protein PUF3
LFRRSKVFFPVLLVVHANLYH